MKPILIPTSHDRTEAPLKPQAGIDGDKNTDTDLKNHVAAPILSTRHGRVLTTISLTYQLFRAVELHSEEHFAAVLPQKTITY